MKVIVDIEDNVEYMSFYLKGLEEIFGHGSMYYSRRAFDDLPQEARFSHSVRFILKDGLRERRYAIDTTDPCTVNAALYDWCDVYGSVNANRKRTPESLQSKLVALCPSFAIRHTGAIRAVAGVLHSMATTRGNRRKQLGRWKRVMQRPRIEDYALCQPREGYVFHLSTLWQSDEWNRNDEGVNLRRAEFIRACRADELPQLFNVLKGEMSIVGPRPERIENVYEYTSAHPEFDLRHRVKAGLTGFAQLYGKYNTSPEDKLNMDLTYIETYSLLKDIKLIILTIKVLFMKESTEGFDKSANEAVIKPDIKRKTEDDENGI